MSRKDANSPWISLQPVGDRIVLFPYLLLSPDSVFGFYGQRIDKNRYQLHNGQTVTATKVKIRPDVKVKDGKFVEITLKPKKGKMNPSKEWLRYEDGI